MRRPQLIYASNFRQFGRGTFVVSNTLRRLPGFDVRPIHATGGMMRGPLRMPAALLAGHLLATRFPDALILGDSARGSEIAWRISRCRRREFALRFGGIWSKDRPVDEFARALGAAQLVIVPSNASRKSLEQQGSRRKDQMIVIIPNGVETQVDAVPLPNIEAPLGLFAIGQVYALKQPELAISTLAEIVAAGRDATLSFFGAGDPTPYLMKARQRGLEERVRFLGLVERPWEQLPENPVLLHMSRREGFGLAVAEGLVRGVPTYVLEGSGGPEELVRFTGGGQVCEPRAASIAGHILSDLAEPRQLGTRLKASMSLAREEYSTEKMLARYQRVLTEQIDTRGRGKRS